MSLLYWLPLNGNSNNQGLTGDIPTIVGTGITYSAGKIGLAATFPNNCSSYITLPPLSLQTGSFCAWIKVLGEGSGSSYQYVISEGRDSNTIGTNIRLTKAGTSLAFVTHGKTINITIELNQWFHIAGTFGNGKISVYKNGVLASSITYTADTDYSQSSNMLVLGKMSYSYTQTANYFPFNGQLNDVRIYDHALSPKEVEEISKGLILHYKLDGNGLGGENLITGTSSNEITYTYPTSGYNDKFSRQTVSIPDGDTYTLSFYAKSTVDGDQIRAHYYNPNTTTLCTSSQGVSRTASDGNIDFTLSTTWEKYWVVYNQSNTTANKTIIFPRMGAVGNTSGVCSGTGTVSIKQVKFEKGGIPTPWSPALSEQVVNSNIIYDSSGYNNNGEIIGTVNSDCNSPRYNLYTNLSTTSSHIHVGGLYTTGFSNSYTFAWWGNCSTYSGKMMWGFSDGVRLNGIYGGNLWNTGDSSNNPIYKPGTTTQVSAPSVNVWHHFAMVGNGTQCLVYLDGVLWGQAKTYKTITGTSIYFNGWDSGTSYTLANTKISDFRMYSTALTATQIKELYDTSASVDSFGNIYAREGIEI